MKRLNTRALQYTLLVVALTTLFTPSAIAQSQNYPNKPIRLVLPYLGGADFVGRWISQKLSTALGQQMVPEPRVGAGGNIGHEYVAKAAPDGYTLMMTSPPAVINPQIYPKVGYDTLKDFAPIALLGSIPSVLVVHPSVPAKNLRELIDLAHRIPDKLTYASGGVGSTSEVAGELFKYVTKSKIVLVPYKGASFALIGAMSGEVDLVIPAASAAAPYVKEGRMRALALLDTKRVASMPQVPTSAEGGVPEFTAVNWYILMAPAKTPRAIIDLLNTESVKAMQAADTRERFAAMGANPITATPEQSAEFLRSEYERWGKVIRAAHIKVEE